MSALCLDATDSGQRNFCKFLLAGETIRELGCLSGTKRHNEQLCKDRSHHAPTKIHPVHTNHAVITIIEFNHEIPIFTITRTRYPRDGLRRSPSRAGESLTGCAVSAARAGVPPTDGSDSVGAFRVTGNNAMFDHCSTAACANPVLKGRIGSESTGVHGHGDRIIR